MIFEVVVAVVLLLLSRALIRRWRRIKAFAKLPGPPCLPLLGNALDLIGTPDQVFGNLQKLLGYGDGLQRLFFGPLAVVVVYRARTIEALLNSGAPLVKGSAYKMMKPFLGTGLISSEGAKWKSRRRLLTPAFHFKILDDFNKVYNKQAGILVSKLEAAAESGKELDIRDRLSLCTLDTIMESSMAWELKSQETTKCEYLENVKRMEAIAQMRQTRPWLRSDFIFNLLGYGKVQDELLKVLHGQSEAAIRRRKAVYFAEKENEEKSSENKHDNGTEPTTKKRRVFLDLMLEESARTDVTMTDADLREEVDTIMFAGHDTTSTATSFTLHFLASHPDVQQRAYEEIMDVVGEDATVTSYHLKELKYVEACMKESMRVATPVPLIARECSEELVLDGYKIPAGAIYMINIFALHRDPKFFPSPEIYDPERFLGENTRHPYAFIPFSIGARNCIGQRFAMLLQKVLLCHILRRYTISTKQTFQDLQVARQTVLVPFQGIMLSLQRRAA